MTIEEMKEKKREHGYTYNMMSQMSGVPLGTVQKIFGGTTTSPRYDTLKALEKKGLIRKIQSEDNKKHIEIVLLDQAEEIVEAGINAQKQFAKNVLSGMTEEEKHMCIKVFDKICNNAEEYLREYRDNADER